MQKHAHSIYQSYLIRCWLMPSSTAGELPVWRFELREVSAEPQKHRFTDVMKLGFFLRTELEAIVARNNEDCGQEASQQGDGLMAD